MSPKRGVTHEAGSERNLDNKAPPALHADLGPGSPEDSLESNRSALGKLRLADTLQQTGHSVGSTKHGPSQLHEVLVPAQKRPADVALSNSGSPSLKRRPSEHFKGEHSGDAIGKISREPDLSTDLGSRKKNAEQRTGRGSPQSRAVGRSAAKERLHSGRKHAAAAHRPPRALGKPESATSAEIRSSAASSDDESLSAPLQTRITSKIDAQLISINDLKTEIQTLYANTYRLEEKVKQVVSVQKASLSAIKGTEPPSSTKTATSSKALPGTTDYNDHFQLIFALHRNLIQEYYDLFRATQYASAHPSAPKEVKNFCHTHQLPSRLWKHGVHNLLEFWRSRLPDSKEYLHAYIYLAYQMFTLLFETVKAFENSWLECLGDLSRYRMAIEQDNAKERDLWLEIADMWYAKAAIPQPNLGRLLHHRAILARRHGVWQMLHFYARSLSAIEPFTVARSSLETTVFKPNLAATTFPPTTPHADSKDTFKDSASRITSAFVRLLALNFDKDAKIISGNYDTALRLYSETLLVYISLAGASYQAIGETMCIACITSVTGWGIVGPAQTNGIRLLFDAAQDRQTTKPPKIAAKDGLIAAAAMKKCIIGSWWLFFRYTFKPLLLQLGDESVLPFVHTALVFIYSLCSILDGIYYLVDDENIPWAELATFLNSWATIRQLKIPSSRFTSSEFPHSSKGFVSGESMKPIEQSTACKVPVNDNVLPEDRSIQGQFWARGYLPKGFFDTAPPPEEEPPSAKDTFDPALGNIRIERCIWLGIRVTEVVKTATMGCNMNGRWLGVEDTINGPKFTTVALSAVSHMQQQIHKIVESNVAIAGIDVVMTDP